MKHFDIDGDGFISFHEYLLIVILLSIPLKVRCPRTTSWTCFTAFEHCFAIPPTRLLLLLTVRCPSKDAETAFAMLDEDDNGSIDKVGNVSFATGLDSLKV